VALKAINKALKPQMHIEQELATGVRRLGLPNLSGKKPAWYWNKQNDKLMREGQRAVYTGGGIGRRLFFQNCFLLQWNIGRIDQIPSYRKIKPRQMLIMHSHAYITSPACSDFFGVAIAPI
jgi:hypothetical protein